MGAGTRRTRPRRARRSAAGARRAAGSPLLEGFEHPLAVAAAEGQALGADAEHRVVVVGARPVDDQDELEVGRLVAALGRVAAAGRGLEGAALPAAVLGV